MSIFLSIASYCDPLLPFTISRALAAARAPQQLHFGVVDQSPPQSPRIQLAKTERARLSYMRVDVQDARGPCWARAIAMSLYDGEDWFLQLDSHMDFESGWDERLIAQAQALLPGRPGVVVSAYPDPFVMEGGQPVRRPTAGAGVLAHVVKRGTGFEPDHPVLSFEAHAVASREPLAGFHLGAGCVFAPGTLAQAFPYDPHFYFHGEEQALALRLFTHGWDIFHMPGLPVYHLYNNAQSGGPARPMHWDGQHDAQRSVSWWQREQKSRQRLAALVAGEPLGAYGLGKARTLAEYAAFSGIDYAARRLEPHAFMPRSAAPPAATCSAATGA